MAWFVTCTVEEKSRRSKNGAQMAGRGEKLGESDGYYTIHRHLSVGSTNS